MRAVSVASTVASITTGYGSGEPGQTESQVVPAKTMTISVPCDIGKAADARFASIPAENAGNDDGHLLLSEYTRTNSIRQVTA